jgi:hypothetical protein
MNSPNLASNIQRSIWYRLKHIKGIVRSIAVERSKVKNILFLITSPRSGSTWILDTLRCHPLISYDNKYSIYLSADLSGYRYPQDLLQVGSRENNFENKWGNWVSIPAFEIDPELIKVTENSTDIEYSIEKIHPEFFNYDYDKFNKYLRDVQSQGGRVKVVYVVRDPESSINSWLNYNSRNPKWNQRMDKEALGEYYYENFSSIQNLMKIFGGIVIDYSDMFDDVTTTISKIYSHIWDRPVKLEDLNIIELSKQATAREKRTKSKSVFLGKEVGIVKGHQTKYSSYFKNHEQVMIKCIETYSTLVKKSF